MRQPGPPPNVTIVLELEASPRVWKVCATLEDQQRLEDWISSHPGLRQLVELAVNLRREGLVE